MVRNSVLRLSYQIPSVGAADAAKPISVFRSNFGRKLHRFMAFYPSSKSYPLSAKKATRLSGTYHIHEYMSSDAPPPK